MFRTQMPLALAEARAAALRGEVPVGAVLCDPSGRVMATAGNRTRALSDPTAHAEILAIRAACAAAQSERLPGHALWVTLEPCPMCAAAIAAANVSAGNDGARSPSSREIQTPTSLTHPSPARACSAAYDGSSSGSIS